VTRWCSPWPSPPRSRWCSSVSSISRWSPAPLGVWQLLGLHLLPGALITAFFFLTGPTIIDAGFPPILSLLLAILLVLIPFELGFLAYYGKRLNGRFSLDGVVLFREHVPTGQFVSLVVILVAWSGLTFSLLTAIDTFSVQRMDNWLPQWSLPEHVIGNPDQYSKSAFALTVFLGFLLNGLAGPILEELYFRGYLLPRIPAATHWAALIMSCCSRPTTSLPPGKTSPASLPSHRSCMWWLGNAISVSACGLIV
jgi:membrane protease YdiL (CAAX protease family)